MKGRHAETSNERHPAVQKRTALPGFINHIKKKFTDFIIILNQQRWLAQTVNIKMNKIKVQCKALAIFGLGISNKI